MHPLRVLFVMFLCAPFAASGPITYHVTVDTSSVNAMSGALDLNFNPGPLLTQSASLQILNFASNGALAGSPTVAGDASGALPATAVFDNGFAFNDYFEGFTYGSTLSFDVNLFGPALSSPDGISTSGSTFAFSMFSDAAGTMPVLTSDTTDGFAFTMDVKLDGTTAVTNFSLQTSVVPAASSTPEPHTWPLMVVGVSLCFALRFQRKRLRHSAIF